MEQNTNITLSLQGINLVLLLGVLIALFKQYSIYKNVRERLNILWRHYCKVHCIPYNALGDDKLVDLVRDSDNFLRIKE